MQLRVSIVVRAFRDSRRYATANVTHKRPQLSLAVDHDPVPLFVTGLATQLAEVKSRGETAIRCDLLVRDHRLNGRQALAIDHLLERGTLDIKSYERLSPGVSRRTLQRDLARLEKAGLIVSEGETNALIYRLK